MLRDQVNKRSNGVLEKLNCTECNIAYCTKYRLYSQIETVKEKLRGSASEFILSYCREVVRVGLI